MRRTTLDSNCFSGDVDIKKSIACILATVLLICSLTLCGTSYEENAWFSDEKLEECLGDLFFSGDVYTGPYSFGGAFLISSNEKENGTFYFPQDTYLNTSYCQDFENDHSRE